MESLSIYSFENPLVFIQEKINFIKNNSQDFTLKSWLKKHQINNPNTLIDVLKEKKPLKINHILLFSDLLKLDASEKTYFQMMYKYSTAKTLEDKMIFKRALEEMAPPENYQILRINNGSLFSKWTNMAILSLSRLKDFDLTPEKIKKSLRHDISIEEIEASLNQLIKLKVLEKNSEGRYIPSAHRVTSPTDLKDSDVHKYFHDVSDLAKEATQQKVSEREFQCFSMAIKKEDIPYIKEKMRDLRNTLARYSKTGEGEEVYQFNLQCFSLTQNSDKKGMPLKKGA